MGLADLESLLKASMGLSAASIGAAAIERAVQERLAACQLDDLHAYLEHVRASATELQALIEAVVVPETWFFRDRAGVRRARPPGSARSGCRRTRRACCRC